MVAPLYDRIGTTYSDYRRPDPRITARIRAANARPPSFSDSPTERMLRPAPPSVSPTRSRCPAAVSGPTERSSSIPTDCARSRAEIAAAKGGCCSPILRTPFHRRIRRCLFRWEA